MRQDKVSAAALKDKTKMVSLHSRGVSQSFNTQLKPFCPPIRVQATLFQKFSCLICSCTKFWATIGKRNCRCHTKVGKCLFLYPPSTDQTLNPDHGSDQQRRTRHQSIEAPQLMLNGQRSNWRMTPNWSNSTAELKRSLYSCAFPDVPAKFSLRKVWH